MSKHVVATVSEIPPGQRKLVTVRGRSIAVFNLAGEFFGLFNRCPHQGGPMCEGILTGLIQSNEPGHYEYSRPGEILRCPWHGWEFDVKTGQSFCDPSKISVRSYPIEVTLRLRDIHMLDAKDAEMTLAAAIALEDELAAKQSRVKDIDTVWRRKAKLVEEFIGAS